MNQRLPISDRLASAMTEHTVRLFRFDAGLRRKIRRMLLERVGRELIAELMRADPAAIQRKAFRDRNVATLTETAGKITKAGYRAVAMEHERAMRGLAEVEEELTRLSVNRVVGTDLLTKTVPDAKLREIARATLIDGAPSRDWWAGQADATRKAFSRAVRTGLEGGESIGTIVGRVRGTATGGGVIPFRDAEALVRTSTMAVTQAVHNEVYHRNDDIVDGVEQLSTLDGRTTVQCIGLHGASWDLSGEPFPDSPFQGVNPPYPRHWNERSLLIPRLKPLPEMLRAAGDKKASRIEALGEATLSDLDERIAATLSFETFLADKSESFVNNLLGKTRAGLWREGKLPLSKLIDQTGRPLTLDQLRQSVRAVTGKAIEEAKAA